MVFHLGPLAPRPELGHVDTEARAARPEGTRAGQRPPERPGRSHDPAGGGHRGRRRRPRRHRRPGVLGPARQRPYGDPRHHPLRPGRASAPGSPPSATSTRSRTASTRSRSHARTGTSSSPWSPPGRRCATPASTSPTEDPWRIGVSLGTAVGGTTRLEHDYVVVSAARRALGRGPPRRPGRICTGRSRRAPSPPRSPSRSARTARCRPSPPAAPPASTRSGYAFHAIEEGRADVCIAGASDSPISPITVACFDAIKATSPNNDDPAHASRPFDADRDGFVLGEGGAVLVLEELEHARARGAHVYCEIGGYATFGNAYHMTGLTAEGLEMAEAIDAALDQARIDATDDRLRQRARLGHQAERPARDGGGQAVPGRPRLRDADELHQVDGRATRSARSARSRSSPASSPWPTRWCRRRRTTRPPTPSATWTTCRAPPAPRRLRQRALGRQRLRRLPVRGAS